MPSLLREYPRCLPSLSDKGGLECHGDIPDSCRDRHKDARGKAGDNPSRCSLPLRSQEHNRRKLFIGRIWVRRGEPDNLLFECRKIELCDPRQDTREFAALSLQTIIVFHCAVSLSPLLCSRRDLNTPCCEKAASRTHRQRRAKQAGKQQPKA